MDNSDTKAAVIIAIVSVVLSLIIIFAVASCQVDNNYHKLGVVKSVEIIARSWNVSDKLVLTLEENQQYIINYDGGNYHSGQTLYENDHGQYKVE